MEYYLTILKMMKIYEEKRICLYPLSYFFLSANIVLNLLNFFVGNYNTFLASTCNV